MRAAGLVHRVAVIGVLAALTVTMAISQGCAAQQPSEKASDAVMRVTRLAGYPAAQVGVDRTQAAVVLWLPSASSAPDIELAWQTGFAALAEAYPKARTYKVVIRTDDATLLSVESSGADVRKAVAGDEPTALRAAASFALLSDVPDPGRLIPKNAGARTQGREAELDRANRAAGLVDDAGPAGRDAQALVGAWQTARAEAPGVPAPSGGAQEAAQFAADRIESALASVSPDGASFLRGFLPDLVAQQEVSLLREWAATSEAVAAGRPLASVLALTASAAREVLGRSNRTSRSASDSAAPVSVSTFTRVPTLDWTTGSSDTTGLVAATLARYGVSQGDVSGLSWRPGDTSQREFAGADVWSAYRAPDGAMYWLPGERSKVALADTSQRGWGYTLLSVALVDANDVRHEYERYQLSGSR